MNRHLIRASEGIVLTLWVTFAATTCCPAPLRAAVTPAKRFPSAKWGTDVLREPLKAFLTHHPGAKCQDEPADEPERKSSWAKWTNCSAESDAVPLEGGSARLSRSECLHPIYARFYRKRLVDVSYLVSARSVLSLLPELEEAFGDPSRLVEGAAGTPVSAEWDRTDATLVVEAVAIQAAIEQRMFLRVNTGVVHPAVRMRLFLIGQQHAD
jgi:hypothetical protein